MEDKRFSRLFVLAIAGIVLLGLTVRIAHLMTASAPIEIAGDSNDYVRYAINLGEHGIYSRAPFNTDALPVPDHFRPPGYPLFLLTCMKIAGNSWSWVSVAYLAQILLGTLTIILTGLLGRAWLSRLPASCAALLMALWPHQIVFTRTLLAETLTAFMLILALWLTSLAVRRASWQLAVLSGMACGSAILVNTVLAAVAAALVLTLLLTRNWKITPQFIAATLLFPMLWQAWTISQPASPVHVQAPSRITMNLVQGSWPEYHAAWRSKDVSEISARIMQEIDDEVATMAQSTRSGLARINARFMQDPTYYAQWYLWQKPYWLWAWDIQLGWGDIHFIPVTGSALERNPLLRINTSILKASNPLIVLAAFITAIIAIFRWRHVSTSLLLLTSTFVVLTAVHVVLQAEPRYSIAYRPLVVLLMVTGCAYVASWTSRRHRQTRTQATTTTGSAPT